MKILKFAPNLVPLILDGSKTSTWRLFDEKNLSVGDELEFRNSVTGEMVAYATVDQVLERELGSLSEGDKFGHEQYPSQEDMYRHFTSYYPGKEVGSATAVKIIRYHLIEKPKQH